MTEAFLAIAALALALGNWRLAVTVRCLELRAAWLEKRVAELERRFYGVAMPASFRKERTRGE